MCKSRKIPKNILIAGQRFGNLVVLSSKPIKVAGSGFCYSCVCDCGGALLVRATYLVTGRVISCGCTAHRNTTHGLSHTKTYATWNAMRDRCNNPASDSYKWYGGRGIKVCERWNNSFENFLEDMGERPEGMEIDRILNDCGYEKGNCRWVTHKVNTQNRSKSDFAKVVEGLTYDQLMSILELIKRDIT